MLGLDVRVARATFTVVAVAALLYGLFLVRKTIFVFVLAVFVSYMIMPLVRLLDRWRPRRVPQFVSVACAFALVAGVAVALSVWIGPVVSSQAAGLVDQIPKWAQRANMEGQLPLPGFLESMREDIESLVHGAMKDASGSALPILRTAGEQAVHLASYVPLLILIPILAFVFVSDGIAIRRRLVALFRAAALRERAGEIVADIDTLLGAYVQALSLLALATFVSYSIFFLVARVPYGVLLALIAAVLEFIPFLGPLVAAVLALLVSAVAGYAHLGWILLFIVAYRAFQDYILSPRLLAGGAKLHPALVIFAFLAGEEIAGVPGMFIAVPVVAIALVIVRAVQARAPAKAADPGAH
jgi:predicted PurR-regulated permease PerM